MSLRANRSSSDHGSDGDGSASTHFSAENYQPNPSPLGNLNPPLYTTDDAVIETSGGLHAPIIRKDSRKLAAQGLERVRSLRRVASEADLKECASDLSSVERSPAITTHHNERPLSTYSVLPTTSQDFVLQLAVTGALPSERTSWTAKPPQTTVENIDGHSTNSVTTIQSYRDTGGSLKHESVGDPPYIVPIDKQSSASMQTSGFDSVHSIFKTSKTTGSSYQTAHSLPSRDSHYSTALADSASSNSASENMTNAPVSPQRYQLRDAPVPSFQGVSPRASNNVSQGHTRSVNIGLQTPFVPIESSSAYGRADTSDHSSSTLSRPPATGYTTATSNVLSTLTAAATSASPSPTLRSSEWASAFPYPVSHRAFSEKAVPRDTDGLSSRQGSRTWTQASHPDSDDDMLADLERRPSTGSSVSKPKVKSYYATAAPAPSKTEWTANTHNDGKTSSGKTPLGNTVDDTSYDTAFESAYTSAPSWQAQSTYITTALGAT